METMSGRLPLVDCSRGFTFAPVRLMPAPEVGG